MAQSPLKNIVDLVPQQDGEQRIDPRLNELVGEVVTLARDTRLLDVVKEEPFLFQDFAKTIRESGQALLTGDIVALLLAFICGGLAARTINVHLLNDGFQKLLGIYSFHEFLVIFGLGAVALLWLDTKGHYRQRLPYWEIVGHIVAVALVGLVVGGFVLFASKIAPSRLWLGLSWALFGVFIFMGRSITRRMLTKNGKWLVPAVLVGNGPTAQAALNAFAREPEMGFKIVEQVPAAAMNELQRPRAWKRFLNARGARYVFLALEGGELEVQQSALKSMTRDRLPCSIVPPWLGLPSSTLSTHHFLMSDVMLLTDTNRLTLPVPRILKRTCDIVLASLALLGVLPIFAVVALMIRRDGGPAFFKQQRVGRHGKLFYCYKFRSMRVDAEETLKQYLAQNPECAAEWQKYQKLRKDVRITKFGEFIRRTSIDELPQIINVLKGEMSLVGPRPMMSGQETFYGDDFMYYESVRPGITGPWQVSGRNKLAFKERVSLESWYARNWSLWMDIVIILRTVPTLLKKDQAF